MNNSNFNIVQCALVAVLVIVSMGLVVACDGMSASRETARRMQNSTQLRGIHQGLVTYANSNRNWFPGINVSGENDGIDVESRFQALLDGDYFTPEYAISPSETDPGIVERVGTSPVTKANYSYAMLQVPDANPDIEDNKQGRRSEWGQSLNSQAIVVSDRNTGTASATDSIHSDNNTAGWLGSVLWNDNHVGFETTDTFETKYDGGELNTSDKLFEANDFFDALMIHTGN
jgi:type II secretory pathway pseudopilin PulG